MGNSKSDGVDKKRSPPLCILGPWGCIHSPLSSVALFLNHLFCFCSKVDGKAWGGDPSQGPAYECLWNVSKYPRVRESSRRVSVSSGLPLPLRFEKFLPRIFLTISAIFLKDVLTFQNSATGQNGLRLVNEGLSFSRIVLSAKYFFDKSKFLINPNGIMMISACFSNKLPIRRDPLGLEDSPENKHWFLRKLHYSVKTQPILGKDCFCKRNVRRD